ncbi:MAG: pyrrolo-quinoline quinone [Anaerolineaceae bacterium]|nr:MAG: pyrrolo-quinoline quinone [Anaerolineaceae bacterium]
MKKKFLALIVLLPVLVVFLAGCATGLTASAWPGIATDSEAAYVAGGPYVYAVNTQTGVELWRFPGKASTAYPFYAVPLLTDDGQLIFGGFDHKLYSLDPSLPAEVYKTEPEKAQNWVFEGAHDHYIGSVLVAGDMVYAPNSDYHLYAVSLASGSLQWSFKADQSLWAAPATDGANVYFGTLGGKVYALDAQTGELVWKTVADSAVLGSPVVKNGLVYVTTYSGSLVALDAASGAIRWNKPLAGRVWSGPLLDGDSLYFGDANGNLYAFDLDGNLVWQQALKGAVVGSPLIKNGVLVAGTDLGNVYFINVASQERDLVPVSGKVFASPAAAGTMFLVAPTDGDILLIALDQTGAQKWVFTPAK